MKFEEIAELCHEANRAICLAMGDTSQSPWAVSESHHRTACRDGVAKQLNNPVDSAEKQHERWVEYMEADGWSYDEVKDTDKKTHPCMKPFSDLPFEQQVKDRVFMAIIDTCKASLPRNSAV